MEIRYHGGNCVSLTAKKVKVVVDDNLHNLGLSGVSGKSSVNIFTQKRLAEGTKTEGFVIDAPGEYEVAAVSVLGFAARAHTDHEEEKSAVVYRVVMSGLMIGVLGHIDAKLSDTQLERLGMVDVLVVPVGGMGYTLDGKSAAKLVKSIEPKIVIPTHYAEKGVKYEVEQAALEEFIKEIGATAEEVDSLKLKAGTLPSEKLSVYQLKRS